MMLEPVRAPVIPRVIVPKTEETARLEDRVRAHLSEGAVGVVHLGGSAGTGKTTALRHLASVFADEPRLVLLDEPAEAEVGDAADDKLILYAAVDRHCVGHLAHYDLAPWSDDDLIEYLLAIHPSQCASVMKRVQAASDRGLPGGLPELWKTVLDELAADEDLRDVTSALRRHLEPQLNDPPLRRLTQHVALERQLGVRKRARKNQRRLCRRLGPSLARLLQLAVFQRLLAADAVVADLRGSHVCKHLARRWPYPLVQAVGETIRGDATVLEHLKELLTQHGAKGQPTIASLLYAADQDWRPTPLQLASIRDAHLPGASWKGVDLTGVNAVGANLRSADLGAAILDESDFSEATLSGARLHGASVRHWLASAVDLSGADLSFARCPRARMMGAMLGEANLEGVLLHRAILEFACLSRARLVRADLSGARLCGAIIDEVDFTGANLEGAMLARLSLRLAEFSGARLVAATLHHCGLEYMSLPGVSFERADLKDATLTGSVIPGGCFRDADLRGTGLADIQWERADLRGADLSGATFHMGSSRSGLVFSPLASEGTRTGFYTDEFEEQAFRAPEDIRKANLRGADLRGAIVNAVDFYLVDLRDALYDAAQRRHFQRCGAILETRV